MTNEEYIQQHRTEDVRALALKRMPEGVDATWCLQQIEGWQLARKKLPTWSAAEGLWFPPRLSMEQCSSEWTAEYKCSVVRRLLPEMSMRAKMADFTGGFGIDFSFMARLFDEAVYVERLPHLCDLARHNFPLLGLDNASVVCCDAQSLFSDMFSGERPSLGVGSSAEDLTSEAYAAVPGNLSLIYLDPARRDGAGRKTVAIEDCTPDVATLQAALLSRARYVVVKLSPMLDISQALVSLRHVREVHVVSVRNECKELLLVMERDYGGEVAFACVNFVATDGKIVAADVSREPPASESGGVSEACETFVCRRSDAMLTEDVLADVPSAYLYEPNVSILKAGVQDALPYIYKVRKLHAMSHLFTSDEAIDGFPGRRFAVDGYSDFGKKGVKGLLAGMSKANLTVRNFPSSVADLRKKLKLKEGGEVYLFATTLRDGRHVLVRCHKA